MRAFKILVLVCLVSALPGCLPIPGAAGGSFPLPRVSSWGYQLQEAHPDEIASAGFGLIVIDYSRDGTDAGMYPRAEIEAIAAAGMIPIAYISIGEAEDYRFYWKTEWKRHPPAWLGRINPDWSGNYKVRYWDPAWKEIVYSYLDRIVSQGFSGIYLDIVDAFEHWSDPENGEQLRLTEGEAARRMIRFVEEIAHYTRGSLGRADFYIIPQNGERILDYDVDNSFLETISGIGIEDLFYDGLDPIPQEEVSYRIGYLERIREAGKPVFVVDYVDDGSGYTGPNKARIDSFIAQCRARGYIPYAAVSDRALDELNVIPDVQPQPPDLSQLDTPRAAR